MIAELGKRGLSPTWMNTGGGCMAVSVFFGEVLPGDALMFRYEILVTEREDNFSESDYSGRDDDRLHGFFAGLYVYDDNGEPVRDECTTVYLSRDGLWSLSEVVDNDGVVPPGESAVALTVEMMACVDAIQFVVQKIEEAETGRAAAEWELSW